MNENFSVLMSLYIKEKSAYARACFESLLHQTVLADEWVIVEDGPLTEELYALLDEYESRYPELIKRVPLKENQGLGKALRAGLPQCSHELIARMDTDDIAREDRFEKQLAMFRQRPELDICGSHIEEFDNDPSKVLCVRKVPLEQEAIIRYQKWRDSFNHVTVMYKKAAVLKAGNYQDAPLMEDSLLWVNMLQTGARAANINDSLVFVRAGQDMFERRGGWSYFKKYREGRKKIYATGFISWWEYIGSLGIQFVVALLPNNIRGKLFVNQLRTSVRAHTHTHTQIVYNGHWLRLYEYAVRPAQVGYAA